MPTLLAKFRDYALIAMKRFSTFSTAAGFFLLLDDGSSKLLLDDGASFLIVRPGGTIESYQVFAPYRDYNLTIEGSGTQHG